MHANATVHPCSACALQFASIQIKIILLLVFTCSHGNTGVDQSVVNMITTD